MLVARKVELTVELKELSMDFPKVAMTVHSLVERLELQMVGESALRKVRCLVEKTVELMEM